MYDLAVRRTFRNTAFLILGLFLVAQLVFAAVFHPMTLVFIILYFAGGTWWLLRKPVVPNLGHCPHCG